MVLSVAVLTSTMRLPCGIKYTIDIFLCHEFIRLLMPSKDNYVPSGRLTRVYNAQERAAIDPFKADYLAASSPAARKAIAQTHIFPALWNYWRSSGHRIDESEMRLRTEELIRWLRNVWRGAKKVSLIQGKKYRLTDVLWWTRQGEVFSEIASIMGIESANTNTAGWFSVRRTAEKNILDRMTDIEKDKLREEADQMAVEGLPVEVQRK